MLWNKLATDWVSQEDAANKGYPSSLFSLIDADGNGLVSKEELDAWMALDGEQQKLLKAKVF